MSQSFDSSRSLTALEQDNTVIAVIEMSKAKWLIAALVPGLERQPLKKINADAPSLLKLLQHWRDEASQAGHTIKRIAVAYEAAGDGFWLARWLWARDIEAYAIHPASVAVSREHRRAKTDRLDTELLMRAFLGWLRGEKRHCSMAAIPTLEEEDARRPNRERQTLVGEQTRLINRIKAILARFGIRSFRLSLRNAADRLMAIHTAEGTSLPDNTRAELHRLLERLDLVRAQIRVIEQDRLRRLAAAQAAPESPHARQVSTSCRLRPGRSTHTDHSKPHLATLYGGLSSDSLPGSAAIVAWGRSPNRPSNPRNHIPLRSSRHDPRQTHRTRSKQSSPSYQFRGGRRSINISGFRDHCYAEKINWI